jgi:hypothetical protein
MRERPILFSAPMVRALLTGTKTQTRRVVKVHIVASMDPPRGKADVEAWYPFVELGDGSFVSVTTLCPYGQPGDRLWVRETFSRHVDESGFGSDKTIYRADGERDGMLWTPSIHMPRWASRITLEVTGVRVERLQDISEADAVAEGIVMEPEGYWGIEGADEDHLRSTPEIAYRNLWESINGPGSWDANPWVWVVEFKRVTA